MRQARILYNKKEAGLLIQEDNGSFIFRYHDSWFQANDTPAISLTMPKTQQEYTSQHLFPFFYNMLPEGSNKQNICFELRIDPNDFFGLLLTTAKYDTIGAIQVKEIL
ncbi:HipA N-terminal domain-containing protein [uncultured Zobellia sp.]|uniref:HipA N-terminal domain-containing protein n=1 Tax=uncultured Zobellia sp. TaxID=255433 RepID=UPI00259516B6|nr:HipA N-terminal domain-containing protein [uncultured Zobellia sp.]